MERRAHYWNGTFGKLARLDVYLYEDGQQWKVEAREGGADGRSKWYEFDDEAEAQDCIAGLTEAPNWRELSV